MKRRQLLLLSALAITAAASAVQAHSFKLGEISIGHPFARATLPGQPAGAVYLRLENRGPADRLVKGSVGKDVAERVEIHVMHMDGDVMRMREVEALDVPANKSTVLQQGGTHLMLIGLKAPLKEGTTIPLSLRFEKAGEVSVTVNVEAVKPAEAGGAHKH